MLSDAGEKMRFWKILGRPNTQFDCSHLHSERSNEYFHFQAPRRNSSLVFVGDVVLDGKTGEHIARGDDPFKSVKEIFTSADLRIANLWCVVALKGDIVDKILTSRAHPRTLPYLAKYVDAGLYRQ